MSGLDQQVELYLPGSLLAPIACYPISLCMAYLFSWVFIGTTRVRERLFLLYTVQACYAGYPVNGRAEDKPDRGYLVSLSRRYDGLLDTIGMLPRTGGGQALYSIYICS